MKTIQILKNIAVLIFGMAAFILLIAECDTVSQTVVAKAIAVVLVFAIICLNNEPQKAH